MTVGDVLSGLPDALAALPVTIDVEAAARLAGWPRNRAYLTIERGEWPSPILRQGRRITVPTIPFLRSLGLIASEAQP